MSKLLAVQIPNWYAWHFFRWFLVVVEFFSRSWRVFNAFHAVIVIRLSFEFLLCWLSLNVYDFCCLLAFSCRKENIFMRLSMCVLRYVHGDMEIYLMGIQLWIWLWNFQSLNFWKNLKEILKFLENFKFSKKNLI